MQRPRGTKDLFGEELQKLNEICSNIKNFLELAGYREIRTPIFEHKEVFLGTEEEYLLSNKEIFRIEGGKYILRPENTASVARAIVENRFLCINSKSTNNKRFYYLGTYFRYERPQEGRYREFIQLGIEEINSAPIEADISQIALINRLLESFGINKALTLHINYLGSKDTKIKWNEELKKYFEEYRDQLSEDSRERINKNPLRILDDKEDSKLEIVKNAPKIEQFLDSKEKEQIENIKERLQKDFDMVFEWDTNLVRGIDYYTGLIYEWKYKELTVIAGGRYDELFCKFNNSVIPSLGLAIGIERFKFLLEKENYVWKNREVAPIYIASLVGLDAKLNWLLKVFEKHNIVYWADFSIVKLNKHFEISLQTESKVMLIYGAKEQEQQGITLKFLGSEKEGDFFEFNEEAINKLIPLIF
ncbi:histidine--tRNA ligase [Candidatus Mycoplasma haematobovis]|uniref:Histidine--tRNA ligase n=1 Tax=Candidatus Mycoplasma haematobovis TaxID=432608 RepID=A0A1A9QEB9_9MOLU|nr:histidine--tRNA ligase [Candidatus Mycoplasma haematobovis]